MERQLASIQRCVGLRPIEGADKIEVARVLSWECVVKKGEFKEGDLGVYIEIDSIVPDKPIFEFLKDKKFKVKTIRLRGQVSQGLYLPMSYFPEIRNPKEDMDVTKLLGVTKYNPEADAEKKMFMAPKNKPWWFKYAIRIPFLRKLLIKPVGGGIAFPTHLVPKTDETRLQAFPASFLEEYAELPVSITQKMDGSSLTIIWHKNRLSVASRNVWFPTRVANQYWNIVDKIGFEAYLKKYHKGQSFAFQGELCGPNIQGNKYKFSEHRLYIFGMYNIKAQMYVTAPSLRLIVEAMIEATGSPYLFHVPILKDNIPIKRIGTTIQDWLGYATTKSFYNEETWNEGIVVRSLDDKPYGISKMNGKRFSFKVISPEFLLQYGL